MHRNPALPGMVGQAAVALLPKRHDLHLTMTKPQTPIQRDFVQKDGPGTFRGDSEEKAEEYSRPMEKNKTSAL